MMLTENPVDFLSTLVVRWITAAGISADLKLSPGFWEIRPKDGAIYWLDGLELTAANYATTGVYSERGAVDKVHIIRGRSMLVFLPQGTSVCLRQVQQEL